MNRGTLSKEAFMTMTKKCVMYAGLAFVLVIAATSSFAQVQKLPISDFLNAQSLSNYECWSDPVSGNILCFDTFGFRAQVWGLDLGTSVSGDVTIRDLHNGTEAVSVNLHTRNAICWGYDVNEDFAFGSNAGGIYNGDPASLGDGLMKIDFRQPVGSPIATLEQIGTPQFPLDSLLASIMCSHGLLRPSGMPGFAQTTQTGLFSTRVPGGCPPEKDADCFPAEKVQFKPTGR